MQGYGDSYLPGMGGAKLIEAMGAQSIPSLQHTPRGAGHGLIGIGIVLLLYGVFFGYGITQYDVVQLDQVSRIDAVPGEAFTMAVTGPGRYELYAARRVARPGYANLNPRRWNGARVPDEVRSFYADAEAQPRDGGWVVQSPAWDYPGGIDLVPTAVWAIPAFDPPAGIHQGTFERDLATAVIGAVLLVVGLVMRIRFVHSVRRASERIEASLHQPDLEGTQSESRRARPAIGPLSGR